MKIAAIIVSSIWLLSCGDANFQRESQRDRQTAPNNQDDGSTSQEPIPETGSDASKSPDQTTTTPNPQPKENDNKTPEALYYPGKKGPYEVLSYIDNLTDPAYNSAIIYYPADPKAKLIGASTLSGGFTNTKEQMSWLGEHLASHGVITIVFTPTNNQSLNPTIWATGHKGSFQKLKSENQRVGSPIQGKVDEKKIGIMGYSMGGAGTILAVNELSTAVKAAVPICAFRPVTPTSSVPMLLQTGTDDTVAVPRNIELAYEAMPATTPKALTKFNGMTHLDVTNGGPPIQQDNIAYYGTAWYRVYLGGDQRYRTYLSGDEQKKKVDAGTFAVAQDFRLYAP